MSCIKRKPHVLKREKALTIPRYFIFLDTETSQHTTIEGSKEQTLKLGWACFYSRAYGRHKEQVDWLYFEDAATFWDFVFNHTYPKQRLWIIARNIVFDFTVVKGWMFLRIERYKLKFFHNNGVSAIVSVTKGNKSIVFLDSMNWFSESLAKTGERIGIPKLKIDFDNCTKDELSRYCRNDVRIEFENFKTFIRFLVDNDISRLCYTKASTAMAAYLYKHYTIPIYIHNNAQAIWLERSSYKGGRCECFFIGNLPNEPYYILDVNSLYPFVMQDNYYPVKYCKIVHKMSIKELRQTVKDKAVVAEVLIDTDEPVYSLRRDRTIFPIGRFTVSLTTPEINYALKHNHIRHVYDCVVYEQAKIFSSYVNSMYNLRRNFTDVTNKEYEVLCKYLLNSLYGKFGQKAERWQKIGDAPNERDREELIFNSYPRRVTRLRYLLGEVFELKGYGESFDSFPAIASHVTAYARLHLWYLMQLAGIGNYFYCDTDSLIVNKQGLFNLTDIISDSELGKLKIQEKLTTLTIRGLKDYTANTKDVIKGIRKNAVQVSDGIYQQQLWPTFKGTLKTEDANTYKVGNVIKHLTREYTKGIVTDSGIVKPLLVLQI